MEARLRLFQAVRAGDKAAFDEVLQPEMQRLHKQADRLLNPRLKHILSPEDLVQETLLRAYRYLATKPLDDGQAFDAWLSTILERTASSATRRHLLTQKRDAQIISLATHTTNGSSENGTLESKVEGKITSPSGRAQRHEFQGRLPKALAAIRPEHRLVIQLVRLENKSFGEAALVLKKSEVATRKLLSRAIDELASVLPRQRDRGST